MSRGRLALADFADSSRFGLKMADSTKETLKQKFDSIYKFEQIRKDISQENVTELSKDRLQECCKELKLKVAGEKKVRWPRRLKRKQKRKRK